MQALRPQDRDFLHRMLKTGLDIYESRVRAIDFVGKTRVLDAGCGFGQWSAALATSNDHVFGVDYSASRLHVAKGLWKQFPNLSFSVGSVENLPLANESVDAVFSYSVIYFTDPVKTLREAHRVLKPQGRLYICTNGWGWFLYNLLERHNPSLDFDPRKYAVATFARSAWYFVARRLAPGRAIATPSWFMGRLLKKTGFSLLALQGEGTINFSGTPINSNYPSRYRGVENVYELVAIKQ